MQIEWNPPKPRKGWLGHWDAFVGPGATSAEEWVQLGAGLAVGGIALLLFGLRFSADISWLHWAIVALLCLDLGGGIVTNATSAAKRWYHREGQSGRDHLMFVAVHGVHLLLMGLLFSLNGWYLGLAYAYLLLAALLILRTPLYLQRSVAFAAYAVGLLLGVVLVPVVGLEWFLPLLFFKLLVSHLLKEAPFDAKDAAR